MRQVDSVSSTASPSGTVPPSLRSSSRAKSTRKLAQQAPHRVQGLSATADMGPREGVQFEADGLISVLSAAGASSGSAGSRTTVTVQAHCETTWADTLPR